MKQQSIRRHLLSNFVYFADDVRASLVTGVDHSVHLQKHWQIIADKLLQCNKVRLGEAVQLHRIFLKNTFDVFCCKH